jgi:hypothetical protein
MVEAVEPFKLHPTFMSYKYEVFEHHQMLGMGIWLHTHSIIITYVSPDLGESAESLGDVTFLGRGIVCNTTTTMNFPTHY